MKTFEPILHQDFPDQDVIRVNDTYYMISTTMHFMPGAVILESKDLLNWKIISYVYDVLDGTDGQRLENGKSIYGQGMWAPAFRYYKGKYYVVFVCNDTHKTYLFTSDNVRGPWNKSEIEGFYHDCALYFEEIDGEDRVFIIYGNREIFLTELKADISGPKENGIHRLLVKDSDKARLGYEGSHFYKIDGKYYLFMIHSLEDRWLRTEACFTSDSLTGEFCGGDVLVVDGYRGAGIAQGCIVDDIDGNWHGLFFQDRGAVGRIPYLMPVNINNGKVEILDPVDTSDVDLSCLSTNEFLDENGKLNLQWQWNHEPKLNLVKFCKDDNSMTITTGEVCNDLEYAKNTLTQRTTEYESSMSVSLDVRNMKDGDIAGISAFLGCYSYVSVIKENGKYYISMRGKDLNKAGNDIWKNEAPLEEYERTELVGQFDNIELMAKVSYKDEDYAEFFYKDPSKNEFINIGIKHKMAFRLDHFCGCRFALFYYATKEANGEVTFRLK